MTTKESASKKRQLEHEIKQRLKDLEKETDCCVKEVKLTIMDGLGSRSIIESIDITLVVK